MIMVDNVMAMAMCCPDKVFGNAMAVAMLGDKLNLFVMLAG